MKEFVEYILKHLVDHPEEVKVSEVVRETRIVYEVKVARDDVGKVLGRHGRTVNAFRYILHAVARKSGKDASLEILNPRD
jgi:predicted RNA-binding protein YlqC (UPF0109 family)